MSERIPLHFPIEHDGVPIAEVALRRPTVGDHLAAQKSSGPLPKWRCAGPRWATIWRRRSRLAPTPSARFA